MIELLIVIVIIGILASMAAIALNGVRLKARDAKRMADMNSMQTALEQYKIDEGSYPTLITVGEAIAGPTSGATYLAKVPTNPTPRDDGSCADSDYTYTQDSSGSSYHLEFCLGKAVNDLTSGDKLLTPSGFSSAPIQVQATFYPDADPESTCVDGQRATNTDQTWANAHAHSINDNGNDTSTAIKVRVQLHYGDQWCWWYRGFVYFDLSSIDVSKITAATFSIIPYSLTEDTPTMDHTIVLTQANSASNTALVQADYDASAGYSTYFSDDELPVNTFTADTRMEYTLNTAGLNYLKSLTGSKIAKFGLKMDSDADNVEPSGWNNSQQVYVLFRSAETAGTASDPKLVVTYTK